MEEYTLYDVEKDYYLGNYQSCINKSNSMPSSEESIFYMCLSYLHLKKYDILNLELSKSSAKCVSMVGILLTYRNEVDKRTSVLKKLDALVEDNSIDSKDELSRLVISSIYADAKAYSNALRLLYQLDTLASLFAQINIFLQMNRVDLAERQLALMQKKDDFATLTLIASAQVRLSGGKAREARDIAKGLEDKYRATPLLKNIQTAASILLEEYDVAKQHCENALDMDNDNFEALINMIFILCKLRSPSDIKNRHYDKLKTLYPGHEFVKEIEGLDAILVQ